MLHPVSVPSAAGASQAATAAAEPELEPHEILLVPQGLRVFLKAEFSHVDPIAYSSIFTFQSELIHASFSFPITVASYGGVKSSNITDAHLVGNHFSQNISFIAIGAPARGESIAQSLAHSSFTKL
jgi:hypothetical protein